MIERKWLLHIRAVADRCCGFPAADHRFTGYEGLSVLAIFARR